MSLYRRSRISSNQSKSFVARRYRRVFVTVILCSLDLALWIFIAARLSSLSAFNVSAVNVYGVDDDIRPAVAAAAAGAMSGRYLWLFPKSNILLYPRGRVTSAVASTSPRIRSVSVQSSGFTAISVIVTEKSPAAVVCPSLPDFVGNSLILKENRGCYLSDASGTLYSPAASTSVIAPNVYYVPSLSGRPGEQAVPSETFSSLQSFYEDSRNGGLKPMAILVKSGGEYEMYASSTVVYFNDAGTMPLELSSLLSFWNRKSEEARASGKPLDLEYIDVRYGANVYYR